MSPTGSGRRQLLALLDRPCPGPCGDTPPSGARRITRQVTRRSGITGAALAALLGAWLPATPAQAAVSADIITATTAASPTIGIVKTSTSTLVGVTLKANVAASAVTLILTQPGTSTAYSGGGFSFFSNACTNKSLAVNGTCTATVRFNSSTKGSFAADAYYSFTSNSVNYSGAISFTATAGTIPGAPTALTTAVTSRNALTIDWSAPTDTGGIPITGYRLTVTDSATSAVAEVLLPATPTSYTATGLTLGTSYSLRVFASNALGESLLSLAGSTTFTLPAPPPVSDLSAVSRSTSITASWKTPTGYLDGYKIQVFNRAMPIDGTIDIATVASTATSFTITDLEPATPYTVKVVSFNSSSSTTTTVDITTQRARPEQPTDFRVAASNATSITLSWASPIQDVEGYVIEYSINGVNWDDAGAPDDPLVTTYEVLDLEPATSYQFRIAAYNFTDDPDGDFSRTLMASTQSGFTNPVRNLVAVGMDETSVRLTWQPPLPSYVDVSAYRIEMRSVTGRDAEAIATEWVDVDEVDPTVTEYLVPDLIPCVEPAAPMANWRGCPRTEYRVISVSDWGDSDPSSSAAAEPDFQLASAPTQVVSEATRPYEISVSWQKAQVGTSPMAGYTIFYSSNPADIACIPNDNGGCDVYADSVDVDAATASTTLTDLDPGTYYIAIVVRIDSQAFGEVFGLMSAASTVDARGEIEPVGGVSATAVSLHSIVVEWMPLRTVWDAPRYLVQISTDGGSTWADAEITTKTATTVSGLRSGQAYTFQVIASDNFTVTEPSDLVDAVVPLAAPRTLKATSENDWSVDMSWTNPDSTAVITGWRIEYQYTSPGAQPSAEGWDESATVDAGATAYRLADVQPCDNTPAFNGICPILHLRVIAFNDDVESPTSADVTAAPVFDLPSAPLLVTATRTDTESFKVSWLASRPGSSDTTGYTIFYSTAATDLAACELSDFGGCTFPADSVDVSSDTTSAVIDGVDSGANYHVLVVARMMSAYWGELHGQPSETDKVAVPMPLDTPANFDVHTIGFSSAAATWDPVYSDDDLVSYSVELSTDGGETWLVAATTNEATVSLRLLAPGTDYQARVIAHHSYATSDPSDAADFHTKSYAIPAKPTVTDFYVDGGGWLTIDPGDDTGATSVVYSAVVTVGIPGGRSLAVDCDQETLECQVPDALPGTPYRVQARVVADGGRQLSQVFMFSPPPVDMSITTDEIPTVESSIYIAAENLRPGTAYLTYGRQRIVVDVDADGCTSATVNFPNVGKKIVTISQGSRRAAGDVWIAGVKAPSKARYGATVSIKVSGAKPGATVRLTASTATAVSKVSTGAAVTLEVSMTNADGVDWTISIDGVDVAADFITTLQPPRR